MDWNENVATSQARQFLATVFPEVDWIHDEHVRRTPERFVNMLRELTSPEEGHFEFTTFSNVVEETGDDEVRVDDMIIQLNISFHSLCAHHVIPFIGRAHVAYIPNEKMVGLSKIARAVKYLAKGLWTQEQLGAAISSYLEEHLDPRGVAVVLEAEHLCMTIRGVHDAGAKTITSSMKGVFLNPTRKARDEFLALIRVGA